MISKPFFSSSDGRSIEFVIEECEGEPISRCAFTAGAEKFCLCRQPGHKFFVATIGDPDADEHPRILNAGSSSLADLLLSELSRGGRHGHYREAVSKIITLFDENAA